MVKAFEEGIPGCLFSFIPFLFHLSLVYVVFTPRFPVALYYIFFPFLVALYLLFPFFSPRFISFRKWSKSYLREIYIV